MRFFSHLLDCDFTLLQHEFVERFVDNLLMLLKSAFDFFLLLGIAFLETEIVPGG
jgi:hypothetical protein